MSLSGSEDGAEFGRRVTGASMPPPIQFNGTFFGDYTGLTAVDDVHPIWMNTRDPDLFVCPGTGAPGVPPTVCTGVARNASVANYRFGWRATHLPDADPLRYLLPHCVRT